MGGLFRSRTTTTKEPYKQEPWKPQQPFLTEGFEAARGALDNALDFNSQVTDPVADLNQGQLSTIDRLAQFGLNQAGQVSDLALRAGVDGMGSIGSYGSNAETIFDTAGRNRTKDVIEDASRFAEDPYLQGQIDAALSDVNRAFQRDQASINSGASGSGNINSTRAGALEAIAMDDAMDRAAAISSEMRGAAYQSGLDRAMAMDSARISDQLGANAQLRDAGALGFDMATRGLDIGSGGLEQALQAYSMLQGQEQAEIDGLRSMTANELDLVAKYMAAVGGGYGSEGYQTQTTKSPSPFQSILGGAATLGGLGWKPFCWVAREVYGADNPDWVLFRNWMLFKAPKWLRNLYLEHGEWFAGVVRRNPWMKRPLRFLMDRVI